MLHRLTGRDVLNVGRGGAGSVSGMVYLVEKRFAALRRMGLEDPSDVVMYFYEGNDLSDNLGEVARHCGHSGRTGATCSEAELDAWIASRGRDGFWAGVPGAFLAPYLLIQAVRGRATGMQARGDRVGLGPAPDAAGTDFEQMLGSRIRVGGVDHCFSAGAEGPGLGLCEGEVELGLRLLDRSIAWIQRRFSGARFTLVYLPAPLTCYPIESDEVRSKPACVDGGTLHPRASVREQSSAMRGRVASIAAARGAGFLDVTPAFCAAGKTTLLHGPADAEHFNEAGYTLLGELLAEELLREPGPAASRGL